MECTVQFPFLLSDLFFLSPNFTHLTDAEVHVPQLQLCCVWVWTLVSHI